MAIHIRRPAPPLANFVETLWLFDGFRQPHAKEMLMPDGSMALIINLHEDRTRIYDRHHLDRCQTHNGCTLTGAHSEYFVIDTDEQLAVAGVQFKPGGGAAFFAEPAHEFHGLHVPLDALWGSFAAELRERLLGTPTAPARFNIMEAALLSRLRLLQRGSAVEFALGQFAAGRTERISGVTDQLGLSPRRFIDMFRRQVGLTPKLFCRVQRFQRALRRITTGQPVDWTKVALDGGYFDQAHFIHDFKAFAGLNPSTYVALRPRHMNHVPLP